jgi:hypothetical protein
MNNTQNLPPDSYSLMGEKYINKTLRGRNGLLVMYPGTELSDNIRCLPQARGQVKSPAFVTPMYSSQLPNEVRPILSKEKQSQGS